KEHNQGVAYLDDGTMVVVDNARRLIGRNADIAVTSVLQTTAGKMIFGRLWEDSDNGAGEHRANGARRYQREVRNSATPLRITDHGEPVTEYFWTEFFLPASTVTRHASYECRNHSRCGKRHAVWKRPCQAVPGTGRHSDHH